MPSRLTTALLGIAASLFLSAALWWYFGSFVFFLFVPFVPFLFRRSTAGRTEPTVSECSQCGFRTTDESYDYCPRDGTRLE